MSDTSNIKRPSAQQRAQQSRAKTQRPSARPAAKSTAKSVSNSHRGSQNSRPQASKHTSIQDLHAHEQAQGSADLYTTEIHGARGSHMNLYQKGATTRKVSKRTENITKHVTPHSDKERKQRIPGRMRGKSSMKTPFVLGALVVCVCAFILVFSFIPRSCSFEPKKGEKVQIVIPKGAGAAQIAELLEDNHIISSKDFSQAVADQGADQKLQPGTYEFTTGQDAAEVVKQLTEGPNSSVGRLTIPEGLTVDKTAAKVEQQLGISQNDFKNQAKASNYVKDYPFLQAAQNDSLEGFLYPSTYDFAGKNPNADQVIRAMLDQYKQVSQKLNMSAAAKKLTNRYGVQVSEYDLLILASIVEREAVSGDDYENVASVFFNRMQKGMPLQSDATMNYVTGGEVTADDLKKESPYNTYLNKKLPPTPICAPSLKSLQAVCDPAQTNYLYFFIVEDPNYQSHDFSETYAQHQQAIARASEAEGKDMSDHQTQ